MKKIDRETIDSLPKEQRLAFMDLNEDDRANILKCMDNLRSCIPQMGRKSAFELLFQMGRLMNRDPRRNGRFRSIDRPE
jgi:hypothetical protein